MGTTRCVLAALLLMQPALAAASTSAMTPDKIDPEYVQNMVTSGLGAAMKVIGEDTHQRFRKLEGDFAEINTAMQNITGAVQHFLHQCRPLWFPSFSMDSLVIVAPLHVALDIIQGHGDKTGWYDFSGLWRPYMQEPDQHKSRTTLRATADPFVPGTQLREQRREPDSSEEPAQSDCDNSEVQNRSGNSDEYGDEGDCDQDLPATHHGEEPDASDCDKSEVHDRHSDAEYYSDEDDWDQDPPASKPETADSFLDSADWRQLKAASWQHLVLADEIDMPKLQELTSDSEFYGHEEDDYGEVDDHGYDPSSRREVEELHEKHQNDANAVSHMLNGGDESSSGRRSREPDSPMYNPGYDPSINKTRRDHHEVPPEQITSKSAKFGADYDLQTEVANRKLRSEQPRCCVCLHLGCKYDQLLKTSCGHYCCTVHRWTSEGIIRCMHS